MKKKRPIHFVYQYSYSSLTACSGSSYVEIIDMPIRKRMTSDFSKGTIDPKKVTCKRCLKNKYYKEALDKAEHPLFYWKENV